jgi:hypothetical protein
MNAIQSVAPRSTSRRTLLGVLIVIAIAAPWLALAVLPPFAQPQSYHAFADQRAWFNVPNALNVLSNVPFALVGAVGVLLVVRGRGVRNSRAPYALLFAGALLTAFGSAWYHAGPTDQTLVWDRLPIATAFAGLVAGTVADRVPPWSGRLTLAFGAVAVASVLVWAATGNLLPYVAMQAAFFATALIVTATVPSRWTHARGVYVAAAVYALAITCERFDKPIAAWLGGALSGHTLKHLLAAAALAAILAMLAARRPSA